MSEEEEYRRDTLYEEVWAKPVKIVAARYGVSDVALAKTCRKMDIPLPGRGYRAKKAAGAAPPRPALPALPPGVPDSLVIHRAPPPRPEREASAETALRMEEEKQSAAAIVVEEVLTRPHPLVREAHTLLGRRRPTTSPCLDISVSRDSLDRALRLMDALLKAFVKRGLTVEVTELRYKDEGPHRYYDRSPDSNATRVLVDGEWVVFGLEEKHKVVLPDPPEPPKNPKGEERERWMRWNQPRRSLEPNGVLVLRLKNVDHVNVRKEWKDGVRTKLEEQLNDVVAHVYLAGEALKEKRLADERAERERLQREIRKLEEDKRRREEERRAKVLLGQMERRRQAQAIREYAAEARHTWESSGDAGEDHTAKVQQWLSWMEEYAGRLDPLPRLAEEATEGLEPKHWWW